MLPRDQPDRIPIAFDDRGLVANAGLTLPVTLVHHLGQGEPMATTKTLRRCFFSLAGSLTLHLPQNWPWQNQFSSALALPS